MRNGFRNGLPIRFSCFAAANPAGILSGRAISGGSIRTGAEYRKALRDGRRIKVLGDGVIEDVTVHPATRAVVDE